MRVYFDELYSMAKYMEVTYNLPFEETKYDLEIYFDKYFQTRDCPSIKQLFQNGFKYSEQIQFITNENEPIYISLAVGFMIVEWEDGEGVEFEKLYCIL